MAEPPIYCIDTSSILEWYVRTYPPAIFESLPPRMELLIEEGRLRAPKVVFDEIRPGDDCHNWVKAQADLFVEESIAVQKLVQQIMAVHHNPLKPLKGINGADPFVIAMAGSAPLPTVVRIGSWSATSTPAAPRAAKFRSSAVRSRSNASISQR